MLTHADAVGRTSSCQRSNQGIRPMQRLPFVSSTQTGLSKRESIAVATCGAAHRPLTHAIALAGSLASLNAHAQATGESVVQPSGSHPGAMRFDVPPGPLSSALSGFADQANIMLSVPGEITAGKTSPGLHGPYDVNAGFNAILNGSELEAVKRDDGSYSLRRASATGAAVPQGTLPTVMGRRHETGRDSYALRGQTGRDGRRAQHSRQPRLHGHPVQHVELHREVHPRSTSDQR